MSPKTKTAPATRRDFGAVRQLPSGRYQASYVVPETGERIKAKHTFVTKTDAVTWLTNIRADMSRGTWVHPKAAEAAAVAVETFAEFAPRALAKRDLKPRTAAHYAALLDAHILPKFGDIALPDITTDHVDDWYTSLSVETPTLRAHCYGLLRSLFNDAVAVRRIAFNPATIKGAGATRRAKTIRPATLDELEAMAAAMPERRRLMVLLAGWCALRFGELAELRRKDIDLTGGKIRVTRGVTRTGGGGGDVIIGTPKSDAGTRDVAIPPHLMPAVIAHLETHTANGANALLFPAADGVSNLTPVTFYGRASVVNSKGVTRTGHGWYFARQAAGRDDMRFHDLRHTGAVLAAQSGATLKELMGRLGHSTPEAAMRYQHVAEDRDAVIAARLSAMAAGPRRAE